MDQLFAQKKLLFDGFNMHFNKMSRSLTKCRSLGPPSKRGDGMGGEKPDVKNAHFDSLNGRIQPLDHSYAFVTRFFSIWQWELWETINN